MIYKKLVKRLRHCSKEHSGCGTCELSDTCVLQSRLLLDAVYAIEFLQTYKVAFENIISMGGWWLVGQDKKLYRMDVPMNWPPKGTKTVELFPLPAPPKEET